MNASNSAGETAMEIRVWVFSTTSMFFSITTASLESSISLLLYFLIFTISIIAIDHTIFLWRNEAALPDFLFFIFFYTGALQKYSFPLRCFMRYRKGRLNDLCFDSFNHKDGG